MADPASAHPSSDTPYLHDYGERYHEHLAERTVAVEAGFLLANLRPGMREHVVDFWCQNIRRFAEGQPLQGTVDRHEGY